MRVDVFIFASSNTTDRLVFYIFVNVKAFSICDSVIESAFFISKQKGRFFMEANIVQDFTKSIKIYFEHDISLNGYNYLIIYGKHINGCFIAIPNWEISCEASCRSNDVFFNMERLKQAG